MDLLQRLRFTLLLMTFLTLVACGGGSLGESVVDPGDVTEPDPITVTLAISNINVTEQTPATITATVMQGSVPVTGEVVTFTTSLGSFTPESGTALTDSSGNANIVLIAGDISGAGVVVASIASSEEGAIGFTTEAISAVIVRLGNSSSGSFAEGIADVSLAQISAGGTTVISVSPYQLASGMISTVEPDSWPLMTAEMCSPETLMELETGSVSL